MVSGQQEKGQKWAICTEKFGEEYVQFEYFQLVSLNFHDLLSFVNRVGIQHGRRFEKCCKLPQFKSVLGDVLLGLNGDLKHL